MQLMQLFELNPLQIKQFGLQLLHCRLVASAKRPIGQFIKQLVPYKKQFKLQDKHESGSSPTQSKQEL